MKFQDPCYVIPEETISPKNEAKEEKKRKRMKSYHSLGSGTMQL